MRNLTTTALERLKGAPTGRCTYCRKQATCWAPITGTPWCSRNPDDFAAACDVCGYKQTEKRRKAWNRKCNEDTKKAGGEGHSLFVGRVLKVQSRPDAVNIEALGELVKNLQAAEQRLADMVVALRADDHTWGEIAEKMGVSRQALMKKYGHLDPEGARQRGGASGRYR
jgi:hypothetical protein